VIPAAVKVSMAAGADCVAVLKPRKGKGSREFDLLPEMARWTGRYVRVVEGEAACDEFLAEHVPSVVLVDTFQESKWDSVNQLTYGNMAKLNALVPRPHVVLGCHNLLQFMVGLHNVTRLFPDLNVTAMVYHPSLAPSLVEASLGTEIEPLFRARAPITQIPLYFAPDGMYANSSYAVDQERVRILSVGELESNRRDYTVIEQLRNTTLKYPVELAFFGKIAHRYIEEYLKDVARSLPLVKVSLYQGNFADLYALAESSAYITTYIDDHSLPETNHLPWDPDLAIKGHEDYVSGKLSSALAVATGFLTPVLGCEDLLAAYGLHSQLQIHSSGSNFADKIVEAVDIYYDDRPTYDAMRLEQCDHRAAFFDGAKTRLAGLIAPPAPGDLLRSETKLPAPKQEDAVPPGLVF